MGGIMVEPVIIGDCTLYNADCMDILPTLGKVDAVVDNSNAVVFNGGHESASRKHSEKQKSPSGMGSQTRGHSGDVREWDAITTSNGGALSSNPDSFSAGNSADGNSAEIEGQGRQAERTLQGRNPEHGIPQDDREEALQQVRGNQPIGYSSQGQYPHEQCARQSGSALQPLPQQPPQARMVELPQGWGIVIDPPYGINAGHGIGRSDRLRIGKNKMDWDSGTPDISMLVDTGVPMVVWGGNYFGLPASRGFLIWDKNNSGRDFADCEMAWTNQDANARLKTLRPMNMDGGKQHPTQKPVAIMEWSIDYLPYCHTILDCFMGSGTTGVACAKMGRKFIGIEREPEYFKIACKRIEEAYKQPDMFIEPPKQPEQTSML